MQPKLFSTQECLGNLPLTYISLGIRVPFQHKCSPLKQHLKLGSTVVRERERHPGEFPEGNILKRHFLSKKAVFQLSACLISERKTILVLLGLTCRNVKGSLGQLNSAGGFRHGLWIMLKHLSPPKLRAWYWSLHPKSQG